MFTIVHWVKKKLPTSLGLHEYNFGVIQDVLKARKKQLQKFQENYEPEKNSATVMIKEIDSN